MLTRRDMLAATATGAGVMLLPSVAARANEKSFGIACRSVHLAYDIPRGVRAACAEAIADQTAPGTYFCVLGYHGGYFGFQDLGNGRKVVIFSVWDSSSENNPNAVPEEKRVAVLHQGEGVEVSRFGGEGAGGKAMYRYDWTLGDTYRFLVSAKRLGDRTAFSGWFGAPAAVAAAGEVEGRPIVWRHMVTFSTITAIDSVRGLYSFVEDFRRNRESTKFARSARFGNLWAHVGGKWWPITRAQFTADANPAVNINAGAKDGWMYLTTGGETVNSDVKLWKHVDVVKPAHALDAATLPKWEDAAE